jgi:hypothetical protein
MFAKERNLDNEEDMKVCPNKTKAISIKKWKVPEKRTINK